MTDINAALIKMKNKHESDQDLIIAKIAAIKKSLSSDDKTLTDSVDEEASTESSEASSIKSL